MDSPAVSYPGACLMTGPSIPSPFLSLSLSRIGARGSSCSHLRQPIHRDHLLLSRSTHHLTTTRMWTWRMHTPHLSRCIPLHLPMPVPRLSRCIPLPLPLPVPRTTMHPPLPQLVPIHHHEIPPFGTCTA